MYRMDRDEARELVHDHSVKTEEETHYLFGRNGIYSFEEDGCIYAVVERNGERYMIQDITQRGRIERTVKTDHISEAITFLKSMGYEPFMRLDIRRHLIDKDQGFIIEEVEQLGYFTDSPSIGDYEVIYGELLKEEMKTDGDKRRIVKDQAEKILQKN